MIQLFLQPTDISELTGFNGNIDFTKLKPAIRLAQVTNLKQILKEPLYDKIYNDFVADTLTGVYKIIFEEHVVFMHAFFTASYYLAFQTNVTSNNGTFKGLSDQGTQTPKQELTGLGNDYKSFAESYEKTFLDYVNSLDIPEWTIKETTTKTGTIWV